MKIVKFSVLALALGLFISSCGSSNTENQTEETTIEETNEIEMAPEAEEAPVVIDSPTGKLDPIHRRNIIKYWPKLTRRAGGSGQVFVLYQPDELNEKQFNDMVADHVSHHYRGIRKQDAADESVIVEWDGRWEDDEL